MQQGDIYLADLNFKEGYEQVGLSPVLVIQNNILNENLNTTVICPITFNTKAKGKLTTYSLPQSISNLEKDSVVLLFQIRAIDKTKLKKKIASLNENIILEIKKQLRFVF